MQHNGRRSRVFGSGAIVAVMEQALAEMGMWGLQLDVLEGQLL